MKKVRVVSKAPFGGELPEIRKVFSQITSDNEKGGQQIHIVPALSLTHTANRKKIITLFSNPAASMNAELGPFLSSPDHFTASAAEWLEKWRKLPASERNRLSKRLKATEKINPLFFRKNPWLAAKDPKVVAERIGIVASALRELKATHKKPGEVVGVVVLGSTAKGYPEKDSDLDCAFVGSKDAANRFDELLADKGVFTDFIHVPPNPERIPSGFHPMLFHGMFIGDKDAFRNLQAQVVSRMGNPQWKDCVRDVEMHQTNLLEGMYRHNVYARPVRIKDVGGLAYHLMKAALIRVPSSDRDEVIFRMLKSKNYSKAMLRTFK